MHDLNRLLTSLIIVKSGILHIYSGKKELIGFGSLHFSGNSLINDKSFLRFISQANNLRVLKLSVKNIGKTNATSQLEYNRHVRHRLQPYNRRLEIPCIKSHSLDDGTENMLKYALLRLPRIKQLCLYRDLRPRIKSFIKLYPPVYPHLANIKFSRF
ncbi:hypothetical protein BX667DRAFT_502323 [Coemansia mojavensis]|nr:hypothetical protein BX667DRAFT_502323 [Coemansia mojavensis]